MHIRLMPKAQRHQMTCIRADGSFTRADLGPRLPFHDLCHYVVERAFGLRGGFFGHVASGYSLESLTRKEVILALGPESWQAEILARALGELATGACTLEQFPARVSEELERLHLAAIPGTTPERAEALLTEFCELQRRYEALPEGGSLELMFS